MFNKMKKRPQIQLLWPLYIIYHPISQAVLNVT